MQVHPADAADAAASDTGQIADGTSPAAEVAVGKDVAAADAAPDVPAAKPCNVKPTLKSLETSYFAASCNFSSCHSKAKHAGELVLEPGESYAQLVGTPALHPGASGWQRVVPGQPDESFLYVKVTAPQAGQGKLMPMGESEPVDPDCAIAALKAWIAAGAPK